MIGMFASNRHTELILQLPYYNDILTVFQTQHDEFVEQHCTPINEWLNMLLDTSKKALEHPRERNNTVDG